jgi:hypothetical protein
MGINSMKGYTGTITLLNSTELRDRVKRELALCPPLNMSERIELLEFSRARVIAESGPLTPPNNARVE